MSIFILFLKIPEKVMFFAKNKIKNKINFFPALHKKLKLLIKIKLKI